MSITYIPAKFGLDAFNCPLCNVYAKQAWYQGKYQHYNGNHIALEDLFICRCDHCYKNSYWLFKNMLYPQSGNVPVANQDLPETALEYYEEARSVLNSSPRAAAALLRLAIEDLFKDLLQSGKSINHDIKQLVKDGLPLPIQRALDVLRVVGNHAVHAGQIDFNDNPEIAQQLFVLINFIATEMITKPKEIEAFYNTLPASDLAAIEKRDGQNG